MTRRTLVAALGWAAAGLAACGNVSRLGVVNETGSPVDDVRVADGTRAWALGDLAPGETARFSGALAGEGGPQISWTFRGRRFSDVGCYYSSGMPATGSVFIVGEKLRFACG